MSERLRILVVSPYLPSRRSGGPVRLHGLLTGLPASHSVSILSFTSGANGIVAAPAEIRERCDEIVAVPNDSLAIAGARKRALQLRSLLSSRSFERLVHERPAFQTALDGLWERSGGFDVVQIEHCFMAQYAYPRGAAVVLDEHNIEHEVRSRTASVAPAGARKLYDHLDHLKLRAEEERAWRSVDACAVTSSRDEATVQRACPRARTAVVPNGVDTRFFAPREGRRERGTILFFGTMSYYPNIDALLFFLREVMPLLRRSYPSARLRIVGAMPPPAIRRWEGPDVTVTGFVEDVRPYLERASVVVAPLRIGGGTRLKILEAMAMATPVVSTTLGAEGLGVTDGRELLITDGAEAFAAQVGRVLHDDDLAARLGRAGRHLVETAYDWRASARALETLHRRALAAHRAGRPTAMLEAALR